MESLFLLDPLKHNTHLLYEKLNHLFDVPYFTEKRFEQAMEKYSLRDRVTGQYFETPQFSFIRVAMRMCLNKGTGEKRIARIKRHYEQYSKVHRSRIQGLFSGRDHELY